MANLFRVEDQVLNRFLLSPPYDTQKSMANSRSLILWAKVIIHCTLWLRGGFSRCIYLNTWLSKSRLSIWNIPTAYFWFQSLKDPKYSLRCMSKNFFLNYHRLPPHPLSFSLSLSLPTMKTIGEELWYGI